MTAIRCTLQLEAAQPGAAVLLFAAPLRPSQAMALPAGDPAVAIVDTGPRRPVEPRPQGARRPRRDGRGRRPAPGESAPASRPGSTGFVEIVRAPTAWCLGVAAVRTGGGRTSVIDLRDRLRAALAELVHDRPVDWVGGGAGSDLVVPAGDSPLGELIRGPFHVALARMIDDDHLAALRQWERVQRLLNPADPGMRASRATAGPVTRPERDVEASACTARIAPATVVETEMPVDLQLDRDGRDGWRLRGRIRSEAIEPTDPRRVRPVRARTPAARRR